MSRKNERRSWFSARRSNAIALLLVVIIYFAGARFVISDPRADEPMHFVIPFAQDMPVFHCPFRTITGIPCPICGITTSSALIVRGDLAGSFHAHPLGPLLALGMALVIPISVLRLISGKDDYATREEGKLNRLVLWMLLAMIAFSWALILLRHYGIIGW